MDRHAQNRRERGYFPLRRYAAIVFFVSFGCCLLPVLGSGVAASFVDAFSAALFRRGGFDGGAGLGLLGIVHVIVAIVAPQIIVVVVVVVEFVVLPDGTSPVSEAASPFHALFSQRFRSEQRSIGGSQNDNVPEFVPRFGDGYVSLLPSRRSSGETHRQVELRNTHGEQALVGESIHGPRDRIAEGSPATRSLQPRSLRLRLPRRLDRRRGRPVFRRQQILPPVSQQDVPRPRLDFPVPRHDHPADGSGIHSLLRRNPTGHFAHRRFVRGIRQLHRRGGDVIGKQLLGMVIAASSGENGVGTRDISKGGRGRRGRGISSGAIPGRGVDAPSVGFGAADRPGGRDDAAAAAGGVAPGSTDRRISTTASAGGVLLIQNPIQSHGSLRSFEWIFRGPRSVRGAESVEASSASSSSTGASRRGTFPGTPAGVGSVPAVGIAVARRGMIDGKSLFGEFAGFAGEFFDFGGGGRGYRRRRRRRGVGRGIRRVVLARRRKRIGVVEHVVAFVVVVVTVVAAVGIVGKGIVVVVVGAVVGAVVVVGDGVVVVVGCRGGAAGGFADDSFGFGEAGRHDLRFTRLFDISKTGQIEMRSLNDCSGRHKLPVTDTSRNVHGFFHAY
mmetsp:Transcript_2599/g.5098  ORF Transcript_2599/g.5098 Transcript_2599/m.5098 type:complete len:614 (-) Transcript_2599:198-2039(-)